jgi:hypothetical protein
MEDHHGRTMRIVPSRLCLALGILAHQPTPTMFVLVGADKDLVAKTDLLIDVGQSTERKTASVQILI